MVDALQQEVTLLKKDVLTAERLAKQSIADTKTKDAQVRIVLIVLITVLIHCNKAHAVLTIIVTTRTHLKKGSQISSLTLQ